MNDELRNPDVALRYTCEFCGAQPGEPCDNPAVPGKPHYSRIPANHEFTAPSVEVIPLEPKTTKRFGR